VCAADTNQYHFLFMLRDGHDFRMRGYMDTKLEDAAQGFPFSAIAAW
jgi:ketosteroid isomerase-like protein